MDRAAPVLKGLLTGAALLATEARREVQVMVEAIVAGWCLQVASTRNNRLRGAAAGFGCCRVRDPLRYLGFPASRYPNACTCLQRL